MFQVEPVPPRVGYKGFVRGLVLGVVSLLALLGAPAVGAIGFQQLVVSEAAAKPLSVAVWYPSDSPAGPQAIGSFRQTVAASGRFSGTKLALILISHGTSGSLASHYDTALALAEAGFVVAAVTHTGDNYMDQSYAGKRLNLIDRPRQVKLVLDYMLGQWPGREHLDSARVGMFGFSLGGFTTLVESGGRPDLRRMLELCSTRPAAPECDFIKQRKGDQLDPLTSAPDWVHDRRVRAAVVAAPAVSYLFGAGSLGDVSIPIQLWRATNDEMAPDEWNSAIVRKELPRKVEEHIVPGVGHYVFLPPCSGSLAQQAPQICSDPAGFDRAVFHRDFNGEIAAFFKKTLGR
jgi:predicted dienelactone hydrolase